MELAQIRGVWRKRSTTISLTSGTYQYNAPADFDSAFRLYYRDSGRFVDIEILSDEEWLERSATRSTDAGTPRYARLTQTSATQQQIELNVPPSASFVTTTASLTLEYWIEVTRLSAASAELLLPANLRHHVGYYGAYLFALGQGDFALSDRLEKRALFGRAEVLRHDISRTGRARKIRPVRAYRVSALAGAVDYGESG